MLFKPLNSAQVDSQNTPPNYFPISFTVDPEYLNNMFKN